jgi:carboxylesterase
MTAITDPRTAGYMDAFQRVFAGPEHRPYYQESGQSAVLVLHGLVGTPAEMRPMAEQLHRMGWTVDVPLLPGHGADIDQLFETDADAWVAKGRECLNRLRATHDQVLVVGHSMGGAVALRIVAELENGDKPCGLILISPFIRLPLDNVWLQLFGPLLRLIVTRMRPFKTIDFDRGPNSEEIRAGILEFMPGLDIDDPEVREQIRGIEVPTRLLGQLGKLGKSARKVAGAIELPTLVLQGSEDEVARPAYTRHLLTQLGGRLSYHEFAAGHNLVRTDRPAWAEVGTAVTAFCSRLLESHRDRGTDTDRAEVREAGL